MKSRKYKRCEHSMRAVYEKGFGIRQPYQFLVDGSFCKASLQHKIDLKERLPIVLGGSVRLMVTGCVMESLRMAARESEDPIITGAPFVARRLELRRCRHDPSLSIQECFLDLIGNSNPFHYGIVSNDEDLKSQIRKVPGVPIIYLERVFPLLESPTSLTLEELRKKETKKLHVSEIEEKILKKEYGEASPSVDLPKYKRKKAKGPNPLSVKRSKKSKLEDFTKERIDPITTTRRQRRRK